MRNPGDHRAWGLLMASALLAAHAPRVLAQCANDNALTGAAVTVPCPGTLTVPCLQGGQYALVNVTAGNNYTFSTCTSTAFDSQITLYDNSGGASLAFNDDACGPLLLQSSVSWTAGFTGQVRALVDEYDCVSNGTCIPLTITCVPPATNDDPCGVQVLGVTNNCIPSTFSNLGATLTTVPPIPAPGCGNLTAASADVWFLFIAPPSGIAIIETGAGTLTDAAMALYTATPNCAGTFTLIQCDDDSGPGFMPHLSFTNLNPGQQYYVRVWGYGAATGSFTLCIHGPTSIPPGDCVYMLELSDSFGDGWGSSNVVITVNGLPYGTYTCNTVYNIALIGVSIGQVLVVQYNATGPFQADNQFILSFLGSGQVVYNSGSPPTGGVVYTTTVTCDPPPAAPEDCIGGITLCNGLGINNNTNNTGTVQDLNPGNFGCLLASEQQGTWYNFSIASGGTLGMTIDPAAPDITMPDYDWAVWGPYPAGSTTTTICPPLGTPIRCSFASWSDSFLTTGSYNTGMGINNIAWANPQYAPPLPNYSDPAGGGDGWTPGINVATGQVYILYISNFDNSGQAFTLSWQLGGGASLDCTVLPVELLTFDADPAGEDVLVRWSTASESGADRFEVQRSRDGLSFEVLGQVPAVGSSASATDYHFLDRTPLDGLLHYRLDQVDLDGNHTLSSVVTIHRSEAHPLPGPFPNPATGDTWWLLPDEAPVQRVDVLDALGRLMGQVMLSADRTGAVVLHTAQWPRGTYTLQAVSADGAVVHRSSLITY